MTVCIAAIYTYSIEGKNRTGIIGASDRMITSHEAVEFEPPSPKISPLFPSEEFPSVVAMTAGDTPFQTAIVLETINVVKERIDLTGNNWTVKDIANIYIECRQILERKCAERDILSPFDLSHETFLSSQSVLSGNFINFIIDRISNYVAPGTETIISGIDKDGAQIYVIRNNEVSCFNKIGFAAIGSGAMHAMSHFMLAKHSYLSSATETLLDTYVAKKKSEVAPGVGQQTDMILIEGGKGYSLKEEIISRLEQTYENILEEEARIQESAKDEIKKYVEDIISEKPT